MEAERGIVVGYIAIGYFILVSIKINYFVLGKKKTKIGPILPEKRTGEGKIRSNVKKKRQATQRKFRQS